MAKLIATINRIRFFNEENGYAILLVEDDKRDLHTVVGTMPAPSAGSKYTFEGDWSTHAKFGKQLNATAMDLMIPSSIDGILLYLAKGPIRGVGDRLAKRIVDQFGEDTFKVIDESPEQLLVIEGIEQNKLNGIIQSWKDNKKSHEIIAFLRSHAIGPNRAIAIYNQYGDETMAIVENDPYRLAFDIDGIGFEIADDVAASFSIESDNPTRVKAGILHALSTASGNGHCALKKADLVRQSARLLDLDRTSVLEGIDSMVALGKLVIDEVAGQQLVYSARMHYAEEETAKRLAALAGPATLDSDIETALNNSAITLSPSQKAAQELVLSNKLSGITGGPGVGKTTILKAVLDSILLKNKSLKVALAAPTGRASQRMAESTGMKAKTIHRLLKFNGKEYQKNADDPLDIDLIVIDEFSMVDLGLMSHLLDAIPDEATVIMVGDKDQLPSVGPGSVLRDIIKSKAVPFGVLTEIRRQGADSGIIVNAHGINHGKMPEHKDDFQLHTGTDIEASKEELLALLTEKLPKQLNVDPREIQILTPSHKGEMGTVKLNQLVQSALNPDPAKKVVRFGIDYGIGDKVIQTKNDAALGIFNGDVGWIMDINFDTKRVMINFDRGLVTMDYSQMGNISLAWAVTIHKSQGSEYPAVILPIVSEHYIQHARNLLYTGVTRGKHAVAIVGDKKSIQRGVSNNPQPNRISGLMERLCDKFGIDVPEPDVSEEVQQTAVKRATTVGRLLKL